MSARVLVVDDEPDELALIERHLRRLGYDVVAVKSAEEALGDEDNLGVDVAIVDLRLPGMGGWELVDVLHARRPGLPVIITSVLDPDDYPQVEAWLPKPFTGEGVQAALARALGESS
ncbi:response regulator [Cellulomonas sp.]|uniref:response regulator n=1 Tax=Cellulomonas sp. TaxID=40001 RepID=UPI003BAA41D5